MNKKYALELISDMDTIRESAHIVEAMFSEMMKGYLLTSSMFLTKDLGKDYLDDMSILKNKSVELSELAMQMLHGITEKYDKTIPTEKPN